MKKLPARDCKRIVVISHAFAIPVFRRRWEKLATETSMEVHLLVPKYWEQYWFGEKVVYSTEDHHDGSFYVHAVDTTNISEWTKYRIKSLGKILKRIEPDLIYLIHEEGILLHHQLYVQKFIHRVQAKVFFFTMNALGRPYSLDKRLFKRLLGRLMWWHIKQSTVAAVGHYPGCLSSLRDGGYTKPVFLQTQVGVDENLFDASSQLREQARRDLNVGSRTVIGYCGRLTDDKGVLELVKVCCELIKKGEQLFVLLVGNGDLKADIEAIFLANHLNSSVFKITEFVDQARVPYYMNCMDIFVLGSKTTVKWIDTFPLVTVQAQSCGLPVLASDSASLPWQLSDTALFFKEGNIVDLNLKLTQLLNDRELRATLSLKGKLRSRAYFCHEGMTESFVKILVQIINDSYEFHGLGESYTQWKAYE